MRKAVFAVLAGMAVMINGAELQAGSLAGVTMPDTQQVAGKTLALNGLGLRTKYMVKVYVAGLYVEQKSSDANAIIKADAPKRIVLQFVHGASKGQMTDAFNESFNDNTPDAVKTMKPDIDKLLGAIDAVKVGDQMIFTYVPGTGTTYAMNGQDKVTIPGAAFGQVMFSVWLGPKPPTAESRPRACRGWARFRPRQRSWSRRRNPSRAATPARPAARRVASRRG